MKFTTKILYSFIFAFLLFLTDVEKSGLPVLAQGTPSWSPQQRIPGFSNDTNPPVLIADKNKTVHAFTSQQVGDTGKEIAVVYCQWTLDGGWTDPVDILLSPIKHEARLLSAFLDQAGMFHVIFFGGDNTEANIYYSKAPAVSAGQVYAWSTPTLIGEGALNPENGAISGDDKGNLVIVFSGVRDGNGLYAIYSNNSGVTWSNPVSIFLTNDDQFFPFDTRIYMGQSGQLYAVWSLYNQAGLGLSVYFSRCDLDQGKWSDPFQLASGAGLGVGLPDVIVYQGNVVVTYYNSDANAQWMVQSSDRGQTWTEPARVAPDHIGRNGAISLVIDSDNVLHLLFGERIPGSGSPDIHGMWHVQMENSHFSDPAPVVSGPLITDSQGDKSFDPFGASAIIVQGNKLLVTWRTDPGPQSKSNGVWYSYTTLNAPELPISTLSAPPLTLNNNPTLTLSNNLPTPTQPDKVLSSYKNGNFENSIPGNNASLENPTFPLMIGLIPVAIFIFFVFIIFYFRHHNHIR
jgi:hypothetical protein